MMTANPPTAQMSDSPGFFWSKVKREIQAREDQSVTLPSPQLISSDWLSRHRYTLASVTACLVATVGVIWFAQAYRTAPTPAVVPIITAVPAVAVEHVSTLIPHSTATPVPTKDNEDTVIWTSGLPWTPNMTQMKTLYANLDT